MNRLSNGLVDFNLRLTLTQKSSPKATFLELPKFLSDAVLSQQVEKNFGNLSFFTTFKPRKEDRGQTVLLSEVRSKTKYI
ncbi:MAG: hypothetical protein ACJAYJ_003802 [Saprospiraceae bacterium]|jgi:hypothetical protein